MADRKWTEEQNQVIGLRDRTLLVSAAAGSGKTAVLVERIIQKVTDTQNPIDIDRILVVTFTRAAAAEMRQRIGVAIEAALEKDPDNSHLQKQSVLLHQANITTIDSFCQNVVRSHFYEIGLEPGFRVADEGELQLLQEDVLDTVLESYYEAKSSEFLRFIENYGKAKSDKNIREMILKLYGYAQSHPWPDQWLIQCPAWYQAENMEELQKQEWMQHLIAHFRAEVSTLEGDCLRLLDICHEWDGPSGYTDAIENDLITLRDLSSSKTWEQWRDCILAYKPKKLSTKKNKDQTEEKKEAVKNGRNAIKKALDKMKKDYFMVDISSQISYLQDTREMVEILVDLTRAFSEAFWQEKNRKNMLSFSDIEHLALQILVDEQSDTPTAVAAEYRAQFHEVMIDEYQDSNYLQEAILKAVSGCSEGVENMFMVGDVKQSIYRFRMARPDLFMGKFNTFSKEESATQRIDLYYNFRSCGNVIRMVNDVFQHAMAQDLGGVEYDEDASLHQLIPTEGEQAESECILIADVLEEEGKLATEAMAVAERIHQMVDQQEIPGIQYSEIAILSRSITGWAQTFQEVFEREGIPLVVTTGTGYFTTIEVQTILAYLKLLDNTYQDIPLAAVMRSPIGGFSDDDMAYIRTLYAREPFYRAVYTYVDEETVDRPQLQKRIQRFLKQLYLFRQQMTYLSTHELLQEIYMETGYYHYVTSMPAGEQRRANLDMLLEKAIAYEQTSYRGLYHFVRYIDRLIKYNVDYGEAETVSDQENAVRFMTIHKSKGLEFPVVFVVGMGKQFNEQDQRSNIVFHPKYGVGMKWQNGSKRLKADTLMRLVLSLEGKKENLGEELRVLYVAMTRAEKKLILTGTYKKEIMAYPKLEVGEKLPFGTRFHASCYWDWVFPALLGCEHPYELKIWDSVEHSMAHTMHRWNVAEQEMALRQALEQVDEALVQKLDQQFTWEYPYVADALIRQKVSVSELKHRAMEELTLSEYTESSEEAPWAQNPPVSLHIPGFIRESEEERNMGAERGSAMHRFMQCLKFSGIPEDVDHQTMLKYVAQERMRMLDEALLTEAENDLLQDGKLAAFLRKEISIRMKRAAQKGLLFNEKPFVMSIPAKRAWKETQSDKSVIVQGIIDVFWQENDGIVLLDYKTDKIDSAEKLADRYREQLLLYQEALNRSNYDVPVNQVLIYSFYLNELIEIN